MKAKDFNEIYPVGSHKIELVLSDGELQMLDKNRITRNQGGEPYSRNDYLSLLIICDYERLQAQIEKLGKCPACLLPLPQGCGGSFQGDASCFLTRDFRKLNLTRVRCTVSADSTTIDDVTCHANLEDAENDN
jgi:hypothetical protein